MEKDERHHTSHGREFMKYLSYPQNLPWLAAPVFTLFVLSLWSWVSSSLSSPEQLLALPTFPAPHLTPAPIPCLCQYIVLNV